MLIEGEFMLRATRQTVYDFLLDPYQVSQCIPGFKKVNVNSRDDFVVTLKSALSPPKATFELHFAVAQKERPKYVKFLVNGIGKGIEVDLELKIQMEDLEISNSLITWAAEAKLGGRVAHVASAKVAKETENLVEAVSNCLQVKVEPKRR
jgi:carbon monoxide dehydrogenase subunit G